MLDLGGLFALASASAPAAAPSAVAATAFAASARTARNDSVLPAWYTPEEVALAAERIAASVVGRLPSSLLWKVAFRLTGAFYTTKNINPPHNNKGENINAAVEIILTQIDTPTHICRALKADGSRCNETFKL
ncbi:hypothetical protein T492DRAFT_843803 [Pavlovales sp. CCMP2436]|nr:hypothetical protein T492DRAFT_843803 [Pavlovales sp. CCMP2436]